MKCDEKETNLTHLFYSCVLLNLPAFRFALSKREKRIQLI